MATLKQLWNELAQIGFNTYFVKCDGKTYNNYTGIPDAIIDREVTHYEYEDYNGFPGIGDTLGVVVTIEVASTTTGMNPVVFRPLSIKEGKE